jgi:hypothetical protein
MDRKIGIVAIVLGLAAFSPAPINQAKGPRKFHAELSQAEIAKQQVFNGLTPVVGQVPRVIRDEGMASSMLRTRGSDHQGEGSINVATQKADKVGASITQATNRIQNSEQEGKYAWIYGLLFIAAAFVAWKVFQYKIEKSTPVPEFSKRFLKEFEKGKV